MTKDKIQRIELHETAYTSIFKSLVGLTNSESVCILEQAKIDIILNTGMITLDGKSGQVIKRKVPDAKE